MGIIGAEENHLSTESGSNYIVLGLISIRNVVDTTAKCIDRCRLSDFFIDQRDIKIG